MVSGAVEKRSSAVLRYKPHRSTYIHICLAVRFFARLASEHFWTAQNMVFFKDPLSAPFINKN
jgi:hypothetical protein